MTRARTSEGGGRDGTTRVRPGLCGAVVLAAASVACQPHEQESLPRHQQVAIGSAEVGGEVVSTVAGEPVTLGEVRAMVAETGLKPPEVLRRLQDRVLLMREAESRGLSGGAEAESLVRKAAVQSLLAERVESLRVSDSALRAAYAEQAERFVIGERRRAEHVLARVDQAADPTLRSRARALAERAIGLLRSEADFASVRQEALSWSLADLEVKAEQLPLTAKKGLFVPAFESALFGAIAVGVVDHVVETSFGFHAIRITEIVPARTTPFAEARDVLQNELLEQLREAEVEKLLRSLLETVPVERDEQAIAQLGALAL